MFNNRFFLHGPSFDDAVERAQNPTTPGPRFTSLARFAHDLLGWFEANPKLQSVKLNCVTLPELEKSPMSVRIRHHFLLTAVGGDVPSADDYALSHLPWQQLGNGVFEVTRDDSLVQRFFALPDDAGVQYQALVYEAALRADQAFEPVHVEHDVGLASSTR